MTKRRVITYYEKDRRMPGWAPTGFWWICWNFLDLTPEEVRARLLRGRIMRSKEGGYSFKAIVTRDKA